MSRIARIEVDHAYFAQLSGKAYVLVRKDERALTYFAHDIPVQYLHDGSALKYRSKLPILVALIAGAPPTVTSPYPA